MSKSGSGQAASGVLFVILSAAANAAYQNNQFDPTAGQFLGATLFRLCSAGALVTSIWQLNQRERCPLSSQKDRFNKDE